MEFTEYFQTLGIISHLREKCAPFVKENLLYLNHEKIPKSLLKCLPNPLGETVLESCHVKDLHGRFFDLIQSDVILAFILHSLHPEEDWNFPIESKRRICFGLYDITFQQLLVKHQVANLNDYNRFIWRKIGDELSRYGMPNYENAIKIGDAIITMSLLKEKYLLPGTYMNKKF